MPSLPARILLFLSSYAPLSGMLVLLFVNKSLIVAGVALLMACTGVFGVLAYLRVVSRLESIPTKIVDCHSRGSEVMSYIVTYIIPFVAVAFSEWQQAVALGVFFIILGFLYVNSDMIHINPTLNFLGYRLYEVTVEGGSVYSLLARGRVEKGRILQLIPIGDEILLEKRRKR